MTAGICIGVAWLIIAAAVCTVPGRFRRKPAPPPPEVVNRIAVLPPVPLPDFWSDGDEVMFRWYAEGAER